MRDTTRIQPSTLAEMMHKAGVRPSAQRMAILRSVAEGHKHPTADEIYREMQEEYPTMSRTTVYNSLHALAEAGLLRELELESGNRRYDFAPQPPHGHLRCICCGRIFDMALPVGLTLTVPYGFSVDSVEIYYRGLCPDCHAKQADKQA